MAKYDEQIRNTAHKDRQLNEAYKDFDENVKKQEAQHDQNQTLQEIDYAEKVFKASQSISKILHKASQEADNRKAGRKAIATQKELQKHILKLNSLPPEERLKRLQAGELDTIIDKYKSENADVSESILIQHTTRLQNIKNNMTLRGIEGAQRDIQQHDEYVMGLELNRIRNRIAKSGRVNKEDRDTLLNTAGSLYTSGTKAHKEAMQKVKSGIFISQVEYFKGTNPIKALTLLNSKKAESILGADWRDRQVKLLTNSLKTKENVAKFYGTGVEKYTKYGNPGQLAVAAGSTGNASVVNATTKFVSILKSKAYNKDTFAITAKDRESVLEQLGSKGNRAEMRDALIKIDKAMANDPVKFYKQTFTQKLLNNVTEEK